MWKLGCIFTYRFLFFEYLALSIFVYFGIWSICVTPNMPVAYMVSGTIYFSKSRG